MDQTEFLSFAEHFALGLTPGCVRADCDAGKTSNAAPGAYSTNVDAYTASLQQRSTGCMPCAAGKYGTATRTCDDCSAGKYTASQSSSTGEHAVDTGAVICNNCVSGKFSSSAGSCVDAAGWQDSSSYTCLDYRTNSWCAGGAVTNSNYAGYDAEENCCACGAVAGSDQESDCQNCPRGKYVDTQGSIDCINCPVGRAVGTTGSGHSTDCIDCVAGEYAASQSSIVGGHEVSAGAAYCNDCLVGKYSSTATQSNSNACIDCLPGRYGDINGASDCQQCPKGKYVTVRTFLQPSVVVLP
jgi:hypothetical protein